MSIAPLVLTTDPTLEVRQAIMASWLSAAASVAQQSGDSEALSVAKFLTSSSEVALPLPRDRIIRIGGAGKTLCKERVFIVPMVAADTWRLPRGDYWLRYARYGGDHETFAEFFPPTRAIYIPSEWQLAPLWQGVTLLHEGLHAFDRLVRRRRMPKPFWRREVNARLLECRVLGRIGGEAFEAYLDQLVQEAPNAWQKYLGERLKVDLSSPESASSATLDQLFGVPISRDDMAARASVVKCCLVHRLIERVYGQRTASKHFADYVREHYT